MSHDPSDLDLRERFAALRREVEAHTPPLALPEAPLPRARPLPAWAAAAAVAAVIVGALWLLRGRDVRGTPDLGQQLLASAQWVAPTDFLLETPGRELLRGVPGFGTGRDELIETTENRRRNES